ncbi:hypothetical protein BCON_0476g00040 [Botryotinia convoluta]|uniref:Uncharacterized protein n=1 Tax=Botryotinia convoluta TaxID=54673 RepID=A0A4Z1H7P8_9HELO|nr:hypothetical protein BCON_0476g00040 [Botryotinia convoluta]
MTERSNTRPDPYIVETAERQSKVISLINQVDEYVRWILAEELRACQVVGGIRSTMLETMMPLDMENPWFDEKDDGSRSSARFTDFIENLENMASQRYVELVTRGRILLVHKLLILNKDIKLCRLQPLSELHSTASIRFRRESYRVILRVLRSDCRSSLSPSRDEWGEIMEEVRLADNGGYPKEPLTANELENYFDPDIFVTQRVRRDSRITENKWRGIIAAKMKIMIDEYKYPKKGKDSPYFQANGDAWDSSSEDDNIAAGVGQSLPGYQQMNQNQQPSSSSSKAGTSNSTESANRQQGHHSISSDSTIHDTETSSKNTIVKKRKRSTSISETSDASTEPESKRRSGKNASTPTVDDPTTSLNVRRM